MHAPCIVCWPELEPVPRISLHWFRCQLWADIVNMAYTSAFTKEFNRKELLTLLSSALDNLDHGNIKKKIEWQAVQGPVSFFKWARRVYALRDRAWENSDLPECCTCCTNRKGENSAIEPTCCGCFTAKCAHIWRWEFSGFSSALSRACRIIPIAVDEKCFVLFENQCSLYNSSGWQGKIWRLSDHC